MKVRKYEGQMLNYTILRGIYFFYCLKLNICSEVDSIIEEMGSKGGRKPAAFIAESLQVRLFLIVPRKKLYYHYNYIINNYACIYIVSKQSNTLF